MRRIIQKQEQVGWNGVDLHYMDMYLQHYTTVISWRELPSDHLDFSQYNYKDIYIKITRIYIYRESGYMLYM